MLIVARNMVNYYILYLHYEMIVAKEKSTRETKDIISESK